MSWLHTFVGLGVLAVVVVALHWDDAAWWAEMREDATTIAAIMAALLVAGAVVAFAVRRWRERPRSGSVRSGHRPREVKEGQTLDTVVLAVALRGATGRQLAERADGWRTLRAAEQVSRLADALRASRESWVSAAWLDDEPVLARIAPDRIDGPLDRLEAALPAPTKAPDASYRGGPDREVVVVALGATSPANIDNLGAGKAAGLDALLDSLGDGRIYYHARLVCGGPIAVEALGQLPLRFRTL